MAINFTGGTIKAGNYAVNTENVSFIEKAGEKEVIIHFNSTGNMSHSWQTITNTFKGVDFDHFIDCFAKAQKEGGVVDVYA